jgi:uncharacterized protein YbjQ (UPF0145 family)
MALNSQEEIELAQLEQELFQPVQTRVPANSGLTPDEELELAQLGQELGTSQPVINNEQEASLGFGTRAQYAIEPIQSNRKALLQERFGTENVLDQNGELYVKQGDQFIPVDKPGISTANFADVAGALPEMVGNVAGGVAGFLGGGPMGAVGAGAVGGGLGSLARQGISAAIGTPQVATPQERAIETGLSTAFGGAGAGLGVLGKKAIEKVKPGISQIIDNLKGAGKEVASQASETTTKTVADTALDASGNIIPNYNPQTPATVMNQFSDQSERAVVQAEKKRLSEIAASEGLPEPTYAQTAQGKAIIAESQIMDMPLVGGKIRKIYDQQISKIRENLEGITGRKISASSDAFEVGTSTRDMAETMIEATKKASQELYEKVEKDGANAMIGKRSLFNRYRNKAAELGLVDLDDAGKPIRAKYAAESSFTPDQFKVIQNAIFEGMDAINRNPSGKILFQNANALRRTIHNYSEELSTSNPNASRILKGFGKELDDTLESVLEKEQPGLSETFKTANTKWREYKTSKEAFTKILSRSSNSDEKIVKTVMGNTDSVIKMKEVLGPERIKEIAQSHMQEVLAKLTKSGMGRADTAIDAINRYRAQYIEALGEDTFKRVINNLSFLNRTGQPLDLSRPGLYTMVSDLTKKTISSYGMNIIGIGKTIAESKGKTLGGAVAGKVFNTTSKVLPTTPKGASGFLNIASDPFQRSMSYMPKDKSGALTERQKESERRKRALSGGKNGNN